MTHPALPLLYEQDGPIARIRFNRPDVLNAIDQATAEAFLEAVTNIAAAPDIRVVVMSGVGRAFVAGGDLASFRTGPVQAAHALITPLHKGLEILDGLSQPVIGSLHGSVAGAGVSLALACDLALAAEGTMFNLAYARVATSLDGSSSWSLPRVVGLRKALELALLAAPFDAAEALRLGILNQVVPSDKLGQATEALAEQLAAGPTFAYGRIKRLVRSSFEHTLPEQLAAELTSFAECAETSDFSEALDAFFGKRKPQFIGR